MKKTIILIFFLLSFILSNAQVKSNKTELGVGIGINYGGYGVSISHEPIKNVSFAIHGGYNLLNLNAGLGLNFFWLPANKKIRPNFKIVYGYNGLIFAKGDNILTEKYNKSYYGPSIGIGFAFRYGDKNQNGVDLDLFLPFRSKAFYNDIEKIKNDKQVVLLHEPMIVCFSVSFHLGLQ